MNDESSIFESQEISIEKMGIDKYIKEDIRENKQPDGFEEQKSHFKIPSP